MQNYKGLFSEPTLTIISINIERITKNKQDILSQLCQTTNCDILCIQETHRDENSIRPDGTGMNLSIEAPHNKYGSAIFTKPSLAISSVAKNIQDDIETLTNNEIIKISKPHKINQVRDSTLASSAESDSSRRSYELTLKDQIMKKYLS
ncbi:hypothetical protein HUJ05_003438 [Dendroctonus ponderosae]|nr:hypothetical protein HUJ05_003438 [Dendroctonus ponderosae]